MGLILGKKSGWVVSVHPRQVVESRSPWYYGTNVRTVTPLEVLRIVY